MKALLIDCNSEKRSVLAKLISQAGHGVEFAESLSDSQIDDTSPAHEIIFLDVDTDAKKRQESLDRFFRDTDARAGYTVAVSECREPGYLHGLLGEVCAGGSPYKGFDDVLFWPIEPGKLDGQLATAQSRAFSSHSDLGGILPFAGSFAEGQLEDNALFDGQLDGFLIADASSFRFLAASPPICRMLGYTQEEMQRMSVPDIHPPALLEVIRGNFKSTLHLKTPITETFQFKRKDGSILSALISAFTIQYRGRLCLIGFIREISERRGIRRTQEEVFKAFISKSAYGFVDFDSEGYVRSATDRFATILGYEPGELRGKHFLELLDKRDHQQALDNFNAATEITFKPPRHYLVLKKNGETCHLELNSLPLVKDGKLVGFQSAALDITAREKAKVALKKSEEMLRNLIENMPSFLLVVDRGGQIRYANHDAKIVTTDEMVGQSSAKYLRCEYRDAYWKALERAFSTQSVQYIEILSYTDTWWSCQLVPVIEDSRAETVMVISTDVTRQKESDEKIRQEQELLRKMLELHERDRELVAFEIHDGFSQQLTGALLNLEASTQFYSADPEHAKQSFDRGMELLRESIAESRRLVAGLRPPVLEEFGIIPAIEHLVSESNADGGPETEFSSNIIEQRLAPPLESAIFRIVQETLTNARRHSQSSKVRLKIFQDNEHVHLVIRDWGVGFEPEKVDGDHFGLKGIRERTRLLGGQSDIEATPGEGTRISIKLPILPSSNSKNGMD